MRADHPREVVYADARRRGPRHAPVVQYQHTGADGELYWHRRELGDGFDRVYAPVKVTRDAVNWSRIAVEHERAIAFVPVVWTRNAPESVEDGFSTDGHPCEGLESEILAMDLELSQLFRNALYNGDPQMVRTGVEGDAPAPMGGGGREADGSKFSWFSPSRGARQGRASRKKAPGTIWNLPAGGDAKLLESTGAGAQIIKGAYDELKRAVSDSLGVVIADPQALGSGDLSARALSRSSARCSTPRARPRGLRRRALRDRVDTRAPLRGAAVGRLPHDARRRLRGDREVLRRPRGRRPRVVRPPASPAWVSSLSLRGPT